MFSRSSRVRKLGKTLANRRHYSSTGKKIDKRKLRSARIGKSHTKLGKKTKIFFILLLLAAFFSWAGYIILFSEYLIVNNIKFILDESDLQEAELNPYVTGILGQSIFNINQSKYKNELMQAFPQIEKAQIKKIFPKTIEVLVKTYPIKANIINKYDNLEKKYLINQGGYLVSKDIENPNLPYIIIYSDKEFELKQKMLSEDKLNKILSSFQNFQDFFNMRVFDITYLMREREIHLRTEKGFDVWIDLQQDITQQMKKLKKAIPHLNIAKESLEYIDLRIPNKIFYKRRK